MGGRRATRCPKDGNQADSMRISSEEASFDSFDIEMVPHEWRRLKMKGVVGEEDI